MMIIVGVALRTSGDVSPVTMQYKVDNRGERFCDRENIRSDFGNWENPKLFLEMRPPDPIIKR